MTALFCGVCGTQMELIAGKYNIYYKCPKCKARISVKDKQHIEKTCKSGEFKNSRFHAVAVKSLIPGVTNLYMRRLRNDNDF